ncbi:MAG TPA: hypothetical protein VMS71_04130 [Candidatus Acidoferrum sp.]|nr:hypothetical protein [Candidatus Acidoferrum sp.]
MRLRHALSVMLFIAVSSSIAQNEFDPDRSGYRPPAKFVNILDINAPIRKGVYPFRLSIVYDSTGKNPQIILVPDLPQLPRQVPVFALFRTFQPNDTTVAVAISLTDRPQKTPSLSMPIVGRSNRTVLQLAYYSDTALYIISNDTCNVEVKRSAQFVKFGRPTVRLPGGTPAVTKR